MTPTSASTAPELTLSELAPRALQSEIRAMSMECDRIGGVNLAQGICDIEVPAAVSEAAIAAIGPVTISTRVWTELRGCARRLPESCAGSTALRSIRTGRSSSPAARQAAFMLH